jgi:hypothetical protein
MHARKGATIIVAAMCIGLAIAGAILLVGLQFHGTPHGEDHGRPAFVKEIPETYAEAWRDPVAQGTAVLAIVTLALAIVTYLLYSSAAETARQAKEDSAKALAASTFATQTLVNMERAYLTGGGDVQWSRGQRYFRVEVANYGKTAAYLSGFYVGFATRAELTSGPRPALHRSVFDDRIPPGGVTRPLHFIPINHPNPDFIYGGFSYRDLQKKRHVFRFILRVQQNGHTRPDVTRGVSGRFRRWT